uniref:Uncharacterized protein n=2 Tax=Timema TaxID=61471 RepID=A0A7R9BB58_TIMSH|nr:unnamed protein product [Timema shepardi]CAD7580191.1 unnamed protein product [Timema californicum]
MQTGGGTFTKQLDNEGAKLMALLKPQFVPLVNLSDSDAAYHFEFPEEEQVEKQSEECLVNPTHSAIIENPVVVVCSTSKLMENNINEPLFSNSQKDLPITNSSMTSPPTKKKNIISKKTFHLIKVI